MWRVLIHPVKKNTINALQIAPFYVSQCLITLSKNYIFFLVKIQGSICIIFENYYDYSMQYKQCV